MRWCEVMWWGEVRRGEEVMWWDEVRRGEVRRSCAVIWWGDGVRLGVRLGGDVRWCGEGRRWGMGMRCIKEKLWGEGGVRWGDQYWEWGEMVSSKVRWEEGMRWGVIRECGEREWGEVRVRSGVRREWYVRWDEIKVVICVFEVRGYSVFGFGFCTLTHMNSITDCRRRSSWSGHYLRS